MRDEHKHHPPRKDQKAGLHANEKAHVKNQKRDDDEEEEGFGHEAHKSGKDEDAGRRN